MRWVVSALEMGVVANIVKEFWSSWDDDIVGQKNRSLPQQVAFLERREIASRWLLSRHWLECNVLSC